ncbi:MAG: substrate-binding periplasmic protein [Sphingomonadaceae bacterium]
MRRLLCLLLLPLLPFAARAGTALTATQPSAPSAPLPLRVCIFDHPFPPLTYPDGSGQVQELMRRGARGLPLALSSAVMPRNECIARLRDGELDAMLAAFLPERLNFSAFPMQGDGPDRSAALAELAIMVFKPHDSPLGWNGQQFLDLGRQPVGTEPGFLHVLKLRQLGVVVDESGSSVEHNMAKLVQHKVAAVLAQQGEGALVVRTSYRGQIEMLAQPFLVTPMYLAFNKGYYQQHRAVLDSYWAALRQQRQSPAFQQYLRAHP